MGIEKQTKKFWGLKIFAGVIIALLIAGAVYIQGVKSFHKKELENAKAKYRAGNQRVQLVEDAKKKRVEFFKNRFFSDFPYKYSFAGANFIRRISLIPMSDIKLSGIKIKPRGQNFAFSITGRVAGAHRLSRESIFYRFQREIEDFEDVIMVNGDRNEQEVSQNSLSFTITGEIVIE